MKRYFLFIIALIVVACKDPAPDKTSKREMFDARGKHVITSFANREQKTMSVLYGNDEAKKCALTGYKIHAANEIFTLVVYKQANNKYWYGSYINGALISVETLTSGTDGLSYQLLEGQVPPDNSVRQIAAADRIRFIFSHQASVFP